MKAQSMTCKCNSDRIIHVSGKTSDMNSISYRSEEHDGYVVDGIGIGSGDYLEFSYCADCGTIQSNVFPLPANLTLAEEEVLIDEF